MIVMEAPGFERPVLTHIKGHHPELAETVLIQFKEHGTLAFIVAHPLNLPGPYRIVAYTNGKPTFDVPEAIAAVVMYVWSVFKDADWESVDKPLTEMDKYFVAVAEKNAVK